MKKLFLSALLIMVGAFVKSQSIIVYATEKIKGAEIPVERTDFDVTINDTLKLKRTSQNDGSLPRISVPKGKYKVMISSEEFADGFEKEVVVNESRTTEVTVFITKLSEAQIEEKRKKK